MKDPAILLYTSDFLTATIFMSMEERGQIITIACLQQQHGHMYLSQIETIVGQLSIQVRDALKMDEDGKFYLERVEVEIERRKKYSKSQSDKVKKRWRAAASEGGNTAVSTAVLPIETEIEKENETEIETERETETEGGVGGTATHAPAEPAQIREVTEAPARNWESTAEPARNWEVTEEPTPVAGSRRTPEVTEALPPVYAERTSEAVEERPLPAPRGLTLPPVGAERTLPASSGLTLPPAREDGQLPPPRPGRRPEDFTPEEIRRIRQRIDKVRPGLSDITKQVLTRTEISRQCGLRNPGFPDVEHYFQATRYTDFLKDRRAPVWPPKREHYLADTPGYVFEDLGIE